MIHGTEGAPKLGRRRQREQRPMFTAGLWRAAAGAQTRDTYETWTVRESLYLYFLWQ
jgi:hypothetical protein